MAPSALRTTFRTARAALREAKRAMRQRVLAARDALPEAARAAASAAIAERIGRRADFEAAQAILVTLPFRNEWELVCWCALRSVRARQSLRLASRMRRGCSSSTRSPIRNAMSS
jgi:hypothetical protein